MIIVYDISSRSSFAAMDKWIEEARNNANPDAVLYIVRLCPPHLRKGIRLIPTA